MVLGDTVNGVECDSGKSESARSDSEKVNKVDGNQVQTTSKCNFKVKYSLEVIEPVKNTWLRNLDYTIFN